MTADETMIHVRFAPDGTVTEISARPAGLGAQDWFNLLSEVAGQYFAALSGGRGLFRLPPAALGAVQAKLGEAA
ncbi:hypothetical protein [Immundisolibacter cernigliae]|uniref:Uncharacterized protein n=1 Tax=Immundisolibacter cernigliae TaxID=1810504 RepID=A0A1B1YPS3_9GAMM|nr:hypothetical protein [Immundisolibacter cernigliae]ANX02773.1 hypothetical protein PG2T_00205 [Immundisolibacter cernigliae]